MTTDTLDIQTRIINEMLLSTEISERDYSADDDFHEHRFEWERDSGDYLSNFCLKQEGN